MSKRRPTIAQRPRRRKRSSRGGCLPAVLAAGVLIMGLCLASLLVVQWVVRNPSAALGEQERLSILIMGTDLRSGESGPARSDSLILAGSHLQTGQAALLSIPRDLWVTIPGVGEQRINAALVFGYDAADPSAGPRLAVTTVEQQFRRPVDRYLLIDFDTFTRLVDGLGGVQVDVPEPITDTQYPTPDYGVTTIHFDAGPQELDGQQALIYVRTRHGDSDFGRSQRQQQVIRAMALKAAKPTTWPRLLNLYRILQDGVQTDLTMGDWPALLGLALKASQGDIATATPGQGYTSPWVAPNGAWVLLPNWPAIDATVSALFGSP